MSHDEPDIGEVTAAFYPANRPRNAFYIHLDLRGDSRSWTDEEIATAQSVLTHEAVVGLILRQEYDSTIAVPLGGRLCWAVCDWSSYGEVVEAEDLTVHITQATFIGIFEGDREPTDSDVADSVAMLRRTVARSCALRRQRAVRAA